MYGGIPFGMAVYGGYIFDFLGTFNLNPVSNVQDVCIVWCS